MRTYLQSDVRLDLLDADRTFFLDLHLRLHRLCPKVSQTNLREVDGRGAPIYKCNGSKCSVGRGIRPAFTTLENAGDLAMLKGQDVVGVPYIECPAAFTLCTEVFSCYLLESGRCFYTTSESVGLPI